MADNVDDRTLRHLQEADWDDLIPRLTQYAIYKLSYLRFHNNSPLSGISKEEIAQEIVMKSIFQVVNGTRKWDLEKNEDLLNFLKSVVKSNISHLFSSKEYKQTKRLCKSSVDGYNQHNETKEFIERSEEVNDSIFRDSPSTPEEIMIEKETCDRLLEIVKGDDELETVILCILEGYTKPKDIAEQMGVEPKVVYNLKKRLRRIYKDILKEKVRWCHEF